MSRYEWEEGSFKLPSAEFTKLRKRFETVVKARQQSMFDHSQKFWKGLSAKEKSDPRAFDQAIDRYCFPPPSQGQPRFGFSAPRYPNGLTEDVAVELHDKLSLRYGVEKPRRLLKTDFEFPTNRTTSFQVGDEASVDFDRDRSSVRWNVGQNNHSVDRARQHPLSSELFGALERIRWTAGTGGYVVGNDEYNEDSRDVGGGGNYTTFAIGPQGEAADPMACVEYLDSKGRRRTRALMWADAEKERKRQARAAAKYERELKARGGQGRVQRGVPSGGQFSGRYHGESGVRL